MNENAQMDYNVPVKKYFIEDDINKLFEGIEIRNFNKGVSKLEKGVKDVRSKSAMKRPMKSSPSRASGIGISEPASLKQALRRSCISQASDLAAIKIRLSKASRLSAVSETAAVKRLYRTVVVEANDTEQHVDGGVGNSVEISLIPERSILDSLHESPESENVPVQVQSTFATHSVLRNEDALKHKASEPPAESESFFQSTDIGYCYLKESSEQKNVIKPCYTSPNLIPAFRSKTFVKKKVLSALACSSKQSSGGSNSGSACSTREFPCQKQEYAPRNGPKEEVKASQDFGGANSIGANSSALESGVTKLGMSSSSYNRTRCILTKADERSKSNEKGQLSQSSKSSIGDYSSTASFTDESYHSRSSRSGYRPHMSKDLRWEAICCVQKQQGNIGLRHFKLLRKLGGGDIGTVYLSELMSTNSLFAVKVMDNDLLTSKRKMTRAQTEKEILQILDHPFLPTLYAHFINDKFSCLVMEYCPGGDLHVLRQKQPSKNFSEQAASTLCIFVIHAFVGRPLMSRVC